MKDKFEKYITKFVVLITDEETIIKRDMQRPKDEQMKERCKILLNNFKNHDFGGEYFLDTSNLSIKETVKIIEDDSRFLI